MKLAALKQLVAPALSALDALGPGTRAKLRVPRQAVPLFIDPVATARARGVVLRAEESFGRAELRRECSYCGEGHKLFLSPAGLDRRCVECAPYGSPYLLRGFGSWRHESIYGFSAPPREPMQCSECPRIEDVARESRWMSRAADECRARRVCHRCLHWVRLIGIAAQPHVVRTEGGQLEMIEPDLPEGSAGAGYGGARFLIRFHDGRLVLTRNLWNQGTVPLHFRSRLSPNAVHLRPCAYCPREATAELAIYPGDRARVPPSTVVAHCGANDCRPARDPEMDRWYPMRFAVKPRRSEPTVAEMLS